jgi:hypothetical protein
MERLVISVDGACSGRRCAGAAIVMQNGRVVAEGSRNLPAAGRYVLAEDIAGVAFARRLLRPGSDTAANIVETENTDVPRVSELGPGEAA